ncbi:precursor of CEP [Salix suchowensis]|nr:precursor of CEP [Salix suchowensis]
MARFEALALIFLVSFTTIVSNIEGRNLSMRTGTPHDTTARRRVLAVALPKGTVPSSSPSKKGHATLDNEQLFARHLASIDRILRSVPSPGAGH